MLSPQSVVRLLLFLGILGTVYAVAFVVLVRWIARRRAVARGETPRPLAGWLRWAVRIDVAAALLGLPCFAYGYLVEPYWLEVTRHRLENTKLAPTAAPLRIAHLSDLHCEDVLRLEREVVKVVAEERPDLIVFCGDCVNADSGLPLFRETLRGLADVAPTYAVRGNWDVFGHHRDDLFDGTGVEELDGRGTRIEVRGTPVWIGGAPFAHRAAHRQALAEVPADAVTLYVTHSPDDVIGPTPEEFHEAAANTVDLCFAGHMHGGQVALPFYGALVAFSRYDKRFEHGLHQLGDTTLSVNRGLGLDGWYFPRVRFLARPELSLYELVPARVEE